MKTPVVRGILIIPNRLQNGSREQSRILKITNDTLRRPFCRLLNRILTIV